MVLFIAQVLNLFWCCVVCLFVSFVTYASEVVSKKTWPNLGSWTLTPMFTFKSLHLGLWSIFSSFFCMWCKVESQLHSFLCGYPVVPAPFFCRLLFPCKIVLAFLSEITDHKCQGLFWTLNSIPLSSMSVFMSILYCLYSWGRKWQSTRVLLLG